MNSRPPPCEGRLETSSKLVSGISGSSYDPRLASRHNHIYHESDQSPVYSFVYLELPFAEDELASYVDRRKQGITKHSMDWVDRVSRDLWKHTHGIISKSTMDELTCLCWLSIVTERTFSHTGFLELLGRTTSIRCLSTCVIRIWGTGRMSALIFELVGSRDVIFPYQITNFTIDALNLIA